jgi:hypothetical protein
MMNMDEPETGQDMGYVLVVKPIGLSGRASFICVD